MRLTKRDKQLIGSQNGYTHLGYYPMKIACIYLRVSTDEQNLTRQADVEHIAGVYREKASGARAD